MKKINLKNVSAGSWARLVLLIAALAASALERFGVSPLPEHYAQAQAVLTTVITALAALVSYWKNNSFTEAAEIADKIMKSLKNNDDS